MTERNLTVDSRALTVRVPIAIRRRGGRKLVLAPDGTNVTAAPVVRRSDNAMVVSAKAKFILATDGVTLEGEDLASGEPVACV